MLISFRTQCIVIGCIMFSMVPAVFEEAYLLNSCEGGCTQRSEHIVNGAYLLVGMLSPIPISLLIDSIPRKSNDKIVQESGKN